MYIINNRFNNKKIIYIIVVISIMIFCLICFLFWDKKTSSNSSKHPLNKGPYSDITQTFLNWQNAFAQRNSIKINTTKTKKHPNGLYKELVYEDGSFFKISETGKIQQAYWRFQEAVPPDNSY